MGNPRHSWPSTPKDDERGLRGPFTRRIQETRIPMRLEKPLQVNSYDKATYFDEQVENIEAILDYHNVWGAVKCRMFATTIRNRAMLYKISLKRESIDSWKELCTQFTAYFTPSWREPFCYSLCLLVMMGCQQEWLPLWLRTHLFSYITQIRVNYWYFYYNLS